MKKVLLPLLLFVHTLPLFGQAVTTSCTQVLRTARATYDQGRLHELPALLEGCLKDANGFSKTEKVEAYRLLVLTYIYLEEPAKADEEMIHLLETDHFFEINESVDPVEFQSLYRKFRTKALFRFGLKFGANFNFIDVTQNHFIWSYGEGQGSYAPKVGIQLGLLFEKEIHDKLTLNPEVFYFTNSFTYTNAGISRYDDPSAVESGQEDRLEVTVSQSRILTNLMVQYKMGKGKLAPYVAGGPSIGYLLSSTLNGDITGGANATLASTDTKDNYNTFVVGITASAGIKYKVGEFYITADVRYLHSLVNAVNEDNRYKQTPANQYLYNNGYIDNDFRMNYPMFNIGLIIPYFKPIKLIK